jgi:hypothetical protein
MTLKTIEHLSVDDLCQRGDHFALPSLTNDPNEDIGLFSLRLSLIAFASTYEAIGRDLARTQSCNGEDERYRREYFERYITAILYSHHFTELALKKLLRTRGKLLPLKLEFDACQLDDLSKGSSLDADKINTIEFSEALKRIVRLVSEKRLKDSISEYVHEHQSVLRKLNTLRNRLWHRGTYVLHYDALDCLFGRDVLPLMFELVQIYKDGLVSYWRPPALHCGIDPFEEIKRVYSDCTQSDMDARRVAIYKELARAAYRNPLAPLKADLPASSLVNRKIRADNNQLVRPAQTECEFHQPDRVIPCPVCGAKTLMKFSSETDGPDGTVSVFTSEIRCALCSLELDRQVISEDMREPKAILDLFGIK